MFNFARRKHDNETLVKLMEASEKYDAHWHVDKKVPLAILLGFVLQTSGMVWFAGRLVMRVELLEKYTVTSAEVKSLADALKNRTEDRITKTEFLGVMSLVNKGILDNTALANENKKGIYTLRDKLWEMNTEMLGKHAISTPLHD